MSKKSEGRGLTAPTIPPRLLRACKMSFLFQIKIEERCPGHTTRLFFVQLKVNQYERENPLKLHDVAIFD